MQMRKKTIGALLLAGMMVFNVGVAAQAATKAEANQNTFEVTASPRFIAIWDCGRGLEREDTGKLAVLGYTDTYFDYTAGVKVELQKYSSGWYTDQTWEDRDGTCAATVDKVISVSSGRYRLKVTHTAYSGSTVVETFEAYSNEVTC